MARNSAALAVADFVTSEPARAVVQFRLTSRLRVLKSSEEGGGLKRICSPSRFRPVVEKGLWDCTTSSGFAPKYHLAELDLKLFAMRSAQGLRLRSSQSS
jgi:hypothetical protein